jgi:uncharacterized membrane protein
VLETRRDLPEEPLRSRPISARTRVAVSLAAGFTLAVPAAAATSWDLLPLVGWDTAGAVLIVWTWLTVWRLDAERTARLADVEDPTRAAADILILSAAVASLAAVGLLLKRAAGSHGAERDLLGILGVASIVVSWLVVHTTFTLRYARLYYSGTDGGVDFKEDAPPCYSDFAYLAFTVGMTFQVSDTDIQAKPIRRTILRHALLSFVFVTGIVATTINLIANLGS